MSKKRGGISIFLAVTFLSLIVFVMSIVEVTRYQILRAQAERMVISGTQSVLAGYDSALKNEYGIFARNPEYGDCFFVMPDLEKTSEKAMVMDFDYYLGENVKVALLSVPEGDDKVAKYPTIFLVADVVLLTKVDLLMPSQPTQGR